MSILKVFYVIVFGLIFGIVGFWNDLNLGSPLIFIEKTSPYFEYIYTYLSMIKFGHIIYLLLFLLFFWRLRVERVFSLNPCKRISFIIFFKNYNPFKTLKIVYKLHQLEHKMIQKRNILRKNHKFREENAYFGEEENEYLKETLSDILCEYQKIFNVISRNISVNFKRFIDETTLETFVRIPSRKEILNASLEDENAEKGRSVKELFCVNDKTDIEDLKHFEKDLKNKSVNSAYNNVLYKDNKYWICNNLKKAEKKDMFFSTSKNYDLYYNSLVVLAICDKVEVGNQVKDKTMGLLIFDSNSNAFEHKITKELGGYLAHKLYNFLDNENIHYSYHKSYKENIIKRCNVSRTKKIIKSKKK